MKYELNQMSYKTFIVKYSDYLLPLLVMAVCSLLMLFSPLVFWFSVPFILSLYFWHKFHFWVILGVSAFVYVVASFIGFGTSEVVNVSLYLLVVSALLGIAWLGKKAFDVLKERKVLEVRAIAGLKRINPNYLAYLVIALFVVVVGAYFGALKSWPIGDDAFLHVGKAMFVRSNFPNITWYPNWYLGLQPFQDYPLTYYFIIALANFVTSVPIAELIIILFFFAMFLLGAAVYRLSRDMGLPWYLGLGFSLAWLALPNTWGETITGGAYLRSFAAPFFILSIVAAYAYVKSINNRKTSWKTLLSTIFLLSFSALLHEMYGLFAAVTVFLFVLLAVRGLKQKLKSILMVFIPVMGLISWWYLPLLSYQFSYQSLTVNDLTLTNLAALSINVTPILLPLTLFLGYVFFFLLFKNKHAFNISLEKKSFLIVFSLFSLFFLVFACFPMPANLYIMAAYDYAVWFGISLMLLIITLSSLFFGSFENTTSNKPSLLKSTPKVLSATLILLIIVSFMVSLPNVYLDNVNPMDPHDWVHPLYQDLGYVNSISSNNFRLAAITRRIYAMNEYAYPELQLTGGRQTGSYHSYYDNIFAERVLLRYHEDKTLYTDERLAVHSTVPYSMDNYYSSMFWMDWYGANGILAASFEQDLPTYHGYYERPQFYDTTTFSDGSTYITYDGSSPILVSTNTPVVGVIGDGTTYNALFQALGELDINSQTIIPVKLGTSDLQQDLQFINIVVASSAQFQTYQTMLENYAKTGGNVVIMNYNPDSTTLENATLTQSGLIFRTYATPLTNIGSSSQILATTSQGTIVSRSTLGTGFITNSSVSIQELYQDASPVASAVLAAILLPNFDISASTPQADNVNVNSTTNASATVTANNNQQTLQGEISQNGQVIYQIPFENQFSTSAVGLIQFEMWNDNQPENVSLRLINSNNNAYLTYNLTDSQWTGWNTFSIPLASFVTLKSNSKLNEFNGMDLVITNNSNGSTGNRSYTLKTQKITYYQIDSNSTYTELSSNWKQANLCQVTVDNSAPARLLWKESYDSNWQITTDPKTSNITSFYAGPGVMLICIPANVSTVQFYMPLSKVDEIGLAVSAITLLLLAVIVTQQKRLSKVLRTARQK